MWLSDLEVTGGVDEKVRGLQVSVQHIGRVNVLQPSQDLVQKVADVVIAEMLCLQQFVKVGLHQVLYDVAETQLKNYSTTLSKINKILRYVQQFNLVHCVLGVHV